MERVESSVNTYAVTVTNGYQFKITNHVKWTLRPFLRALHETFDKDGEKRTNVDGVLATLTEYEDRNYKVEVGIKPELNYQFNKKFSIDLGVGFFLKF